MALVFLKGFTSLSVNDYFLFFLLYHVLGDGLGPPQS